MYGCRPEQNAQPRSAYATCADFCESFVRDLQPLYLLAFLLTGSHAEAEQCFVATVEEALRARDVFKGWERSWTKRCLITNAIRRVFPEPAESNAKQDDGCAVEVDSQVCFTINAVTRLAPALQRLTFVMSVLERYSEHECALLLGRTPRDVDQARIHALWQLSGFT